MLVYFEIARPKRFEIIFETWQVQLSKVGSSVRIKSWRCSLQRFCAAHIPSPRDARRL